MSETTLFKRMQHDLREQLANQYQRMRVVGIQADGRLRVASLDPSIAYEETIPAANGIVVSIGDDVVAVRVHGGLIAVCGIPSDV